MDERIIAPNLAQLYITAADRYGELPAFATRQSSRRWTPVSYRSLLEDGLNLATSLIRLGVGQREHVGLFSDNRVEWIQSDYAIQLSGAVTVPRGSDVTDEELVYIVNHAGIRVAFIENNAMCRRVSRLRDRMPDLRNLILMERESDVDPAAEMLEAHMKSGAESRRAGDDSAMDRIGNIGPDDLFTLIYTSGTTGQPKGVMLTHRNIMSQMEMIPIELRFTDRVLSILPVWHIFERVFEVYTISCGACTYYSNVRMLGEDMQQVEPTFMGSAPRLWESLHQRIRAAVRESHPMRRLLFHTGYALAHYYKESLFALRGNDLRVEPTPLLRREGRRLYHLLRWFILLPCYGFFNAAVLEPIRQRTGGALKATISGGGALPVEIDRFFNYLGIPVLEGYGMTETSPVIAVRTHERLVVGTVGPVMPDTEVRIVDIETGEVLFPAEGMPGMGRGRKGEIEVRGPQVMKGYYRQPDLTSETIRDGWLRTGDLGMMTWNDCLRILGRRKSTVVLSSGENLEPEPIEMRVVQSPYIEHAMVVGQDRKQIALLVVASLEGFRLDGVRANSLEELNAVPEVEAVIRREIRTRISMERGFKRHEQIREFRLLNEPFSVGEELTGLFKLRRHHVEQKYAGLIREIYEE